MQATSHIHSHSRHRAFAPVLLFVLALLLAQTLGFVHKVLHHTSVSHMLVAQVNVPESVVPRLSIDAPGHKLHGLSPNLFHHSEDDPTCRLFDQAGSADSLACPPAIVLPMAVSLFVLRFFQGEVLARWVALFEARGPPSVR